jgi:uncharacterized protein with HEPN domain
VTAIGSSTSRSPPRRSQSYVESKSEADFHADNMLHDAVIMQLIVMGESVTRLSADFRAKHPEIDWPNIINLRHRLAHDYFGTDLRTAWDIATAHVPTLHAQLTQILAAEFPEAIE